MSRRSEIRTLDDLDRSVRSLARHFGTDAVIVIGSQAILVSWPDAPIRMRMSPEIDAYPANARLWEARQKAESPSADAEASEEIFALFGEGSSFHAAHGFYIDGVDERTARLPPSWPARVVGRTIEGSDGRTITAFAPGIDDLIVAKLARLAEKDRTFIASFHRVRPLDTNIIAARMTEAGFGQALFDRATAFLGGLPSSGLGSAPRSSPLPVPTHPGNTHGAIVMDAGRSVSVRMWNAALGLYECLDNPIGPAVVTREGEATYMLGGVVLPEAAWRGHPTVAAASRGDLTGYERPPWASRPGSAEDP